MIHIVKAFNIVNAVEVVVFLELSCFFYDPTDVGNLLAGSSLGLTTPNYVTFSSQIFLLIFSNIMQ